MKLRRLLLVELVQSRLVLLVPVTQLPLEAEAAVTVALRTVAVEVAAVALLPEVQPGG